jgi:hypothetical protein
MKIVINSCFGGFGLSPDAVRRYAELKGYHIVESVEEGSWRMIFIHPTYSGSYEDMTEDEKEGLISYYNIPRDDLALIQVVEEMGEPASGRFAELKVIEIPDDVDWIIQEYDGNEWVAENHRTWS